MSEIWTKDPVLITAASAFPATPEEMRSQVRMTATDEDAVLLGYVQAATAAIELRLGRKLITQTFDVYYTGLSDPMILPFAPLGSAGVTSVKYLDASQVLQTLATSVWEAGEKHRLPTVRLKYNQTYPATLGHADDVVIRAPFGYGTSGSSVPQPIRQAIMLFAAHLNENREPVNIGNIVNVIPYTIEDLIAQYCLDVV